MIKLMSRLLGNSTIQIPITTGDTSHGLKRLFRRPIGDQLPASAVGKIPPLSLESRAPVRETPGYASWAAMKQRCDNPNNTSYAQYGAKGIKYVPEWGDFETFIKDMGQPQQTGDSLDRIDPNGNYEPKNCRWASKVDQARNRRTTRLITFEGNQHALSELAGRFGVAPSTLAARLDSGMTAEEAVSRPVVRGGDRRSQARLYARPHDCDRWPSGLKEEVEAKCEELYQRRRVTDREISRPTFFLQVSTDRSDDAHEAASTAIDPSERAELRAEAMRIERYRTEAMELEARLRSSQRAGKERGNHQ